MKTIINSSVRRKTQAGEKELSQGRIDKAISSYSRAIFLSRDSAWLYDKLASLYEQLRDYSTALNLYKKSFSLDNREEIKAKIRSLILKKGLSLLQINSIRNILHHTSYKEFSDSYEDWVQNILLQQTHAKVRNSLAFIQTGNKQFAIQQLNGVISAGDPQALALRGKIYWSLGRQNQGNADFWLLKERCPDNEEVRCFMRMIIPQMDSLLKETRYLLLENNTDKCLLNIKKGLMIYPGNTDLLVMRAFINRKRRQFESSLQDLSLALRTASNPAEINNQMGITYNQMGMIAFQLKHYEEALRMFEMAIARKPDQWGFILNLGDSHRALDNLEEAQSAYSKAQKMAPSKPQISLRMAIVQCSKGVKYFNKGLLSQAKGCFQHAVDYEPNQAGYRGLLGRTLAQLGELQSAKQHLRRAVQLDPQNYQILQLFKQLMGTTTITTVK